MAQSDIRVMTARVRRAVEGVGAGAGILTEDEIKDLIADALSDILLYTGSVFGHELLVTERDVNDWPIEYATSDELTLAEQSVVAAQAALTHFFFTFASAKVSERISDESTSWEYALSGSLIRDWLKYLIGERDRALEQIVAAGAALEVYESFLAVRDVATSRLIEPWVAGVGANGGQDYRFGGG